MSCWKTQHTLARPSLPFLQVWLLGSLASRRFVGSACAREVWLVTEALSVRMSSKAVWEKWVQCMVRVSRATG